MSKKLINKWTLPILILVLIGIIGFRFLVDNEKYVSVNISLQFDGIEKGMNPDDTRFNYNELISEEVVQKICEESGITYSEEMLNLFSVAPVLPSNTVDRIKQELIDGNDYTYFPNEFQIRIDLDNELGVTKNAALAIAEAYPSAYQEFFIGRYSYPFMDLANILSYFDYSAYDYSEYAEVFEKEYDVIVNYLLLLEKEDPEFVSTSGYTFRNLIESITLSKELSIKELNALVDEFNLSKNTEQLLIKYLYMVRMHEQDQNISEGTFTMTQELLDLIESNRTNVILPNVSGENLTISALNESYDEMVAMANDAKVSSKESEEEIRFLQKKIDELANSDTQSYEMTQAKEKVDILVVDLSDKLKAFAGHVEEVAQEYFEQRYQESIVSVGAPKVN